jgi:quercetin dioxygenase-like cupin family protein
MMTAPHTLIPDLNAEIEIPANGILSRTIYGDATVSAVLFGFDAGQELSEHTASRPALIQIVRGEARLTLGPDALDARPGTWVRMPAGLSHSVRAITPLVLLLVLLPNPDRSTPAT